MQVRIKIALALFAALATATAAQAAVYGPGIPTRAQYVANAEKICKKDTLAINHVNKSTNKNLKKGDNKKAGQSLLKGAGIFRKGVGKIARLTRPPADAALLGRWIKSLRIDVKLFARLGHAVGAHGVGSPTPRVLKQSGKHGTKTNQIVNGFGFHFCLLGVKN